MKEVSVLDFIIFSGGEKNYDVGFAFLYISSLSALDIYSIDRTTKPFYFLSEV